jgi:protein-S-isoprenylcysteine O-methyltransferase Ste14
MTTPGNPEAGTGRRIAARGAILLSFIVAFEIIIMISPFALFFYSVFNPVLLTLNRWSATRWLTAFFLPHMVVPPDALLMTIRLAGSVLFVVGVAAFVICAVQVYASKALKSGPVHRGLYAVIRHPQYVALACAALGLAIMWPRFLTLVLLAVMLFLYYLLAKDEERRMLARYGDSYRTYMTRTGMFLPGAAEALWQAGARAERPVTAARGMAILVVLLGVVLGAGFALRAYTVHRLPLQTEGRIDVIGITAEDAAAGSQLLTSVSQDPAVASRLRAARATPGARMLAYVIPIDYTMQGMIADTGDQWKLFMQHKTVGMIVEYVIHPTAHLTEGHAGHAGLPTQGMSMHDSPAMQRRIIFVEVSSPAGALASAREDFDIGVRRRPVFLVDVHLHTGEVLAVKDIPPGTGWGTVPTPMF